MNWNFLFNLTYKELFITNNLLSIIFVTLIGLYFLFNFFGDTNQENLNHFSRGIGIEPPDEKKEKIRRVNFDSEDILGRDILDVKYETKSVQIEAWNNSKFKQKFLKLFPDFEDMKYFISEYTRGDALQEYLTDRVDSVEYDFFSGKIDSEEAYRKINYTY